MKLPFSNDGTGKGMMMSGTSTGRKELIYERRETSLIGGNGLQRREMVDKAVQIDTIQHRANMELGSGDTSDCFIEIQTNSDSFNNDHRYDNYDYQTLQKTHINESSSVPPPTTPTTQQPTKGKFISTSSESLNKWTNDFLEEGKSDSDNYFKGKENKSTDTKNATTAVVEDNKPSFTANESNPTVPSAAEPSKTSTLRLSDRTRSESEDDIEKADDPEQDGTFTKHKTIHKAIATTEESPNSEKMDKNGNKPDAEPVEADNDCIVQCLYYTIQCCECVIF